MQQVAAHKTDLAALPFAATNTAKAVETGIDSQSKNHNGDAFKSLYQEAKSSSNASTQTETSASSSKQLSKQDTDKQHSGRQTDVTSHSPRQDVKKSSTDAQHEVNSQAQAVSQGNASSNAQSVAKQGKDKDAGHTNLPTNHKSDDIALSGVGTGDNTVQIVDLHGNPVGEEALQNEVTDNILITGVPTGEHAVEGEPIAEKQNVGDIIIDNPEVGDPIDTESQGGSFPSDISEVDVDSGSDDVTVQDSSLSSVDEVVAQDLTSETEISDSITTQGSSPVGVEDSVTQGIASDAEYVVGEGGKKDREAGRAGDTKREEGQLTDKHDVDGESSDEELLVGLGTGIDDSSQEDTIFETLKNNTGHETQLPLVGGYNGEAVNVGDSSDDAERYTASETSDNSGTNISENAEENIDWLSFVESVMNRGSEGHTVADADIGEETSEHQLEPITPIQPEYSLQTNEGDEQGAVTTSFETNEGEEQGAVTTSFEDVINSLEEKDIDAVVSMLGEMLAALQQTSSETNSDSSTSNTEVGSKKSDELAIALNSLKALLQQLTDGAGKESKGLDNALTDTSEIATNVNDATNAQTLTGVFDTTEKSIGSGTTIDINAIKDIINNDEVLAKLTPEEAFVLKLLGDELPSSEQLVSEETSSYLSELATKLSALNSQGSVSKESAASVSPSNASTVADNSHSTTSNTNFLDESQTLLAAISEMPAETAAKATEAFADRMVAAMPSGPQQQAVKNNIIAGINEFQQQIQQGREPGIDLSAIVAEAAKEAMVSAEVASSLNSRTESQASQFLQLVNNTQNSVNQVLQGQLTQADTIINESNQLKAEASKSQQQFEGFDKAVNIHKPEGQQQLNEKIRWMVNARNTMAEIRLDPPEMGSMQVRVNVSGEAASVSFIVQSQQAKDALADAMPKLRDMLAEQGIELGDAQVRKDNSSGSESEGRFAGESGQSKRGGGSGDHDGMDDMENGRIVEQSVSRQTVGGIDYYA